jgi:hypothetical protein
MPNDNAAGSTSKPARSLEHTAGRYVERLQGRRSPAGRRQAPALLEVTSR